MFESTDVSAGLCEPIATQSSWCVYMLRMRNGHLYTGITNNLPRRLRQHRGELVGGAKALRGKGPLELVYQQTFPDRSSASVAEYQLKQLSKVQKEAFLHCDKQTYCR